MGTKDVWAVDYMPVQLARDEFVQFFYNPDYLRPKKWCHLRTDPESLYEQTGIIPYQSPLVVDGGNIVKGEEVAIVTEKVFKENGSLSKVEVECQLKNSLRIERILFIPNEPGDYIGHADGMIRFIDDKHVLMNNYPNSGTYRNLKDAIIKILDTEGIGVTLLPYTADSNQSSDDASGCYINYLEVMNCIFFPVFGRKEDNEAQGIIQECFRGKKVIPVQSCEIAVQGGVLNCITWNIFK
jgi:agmatine deiminase